jgi:hypothetical protein
MKYILISTSYSAPSFLFHCLLTFVFICLFKWSHFIFKNVSFNFGSLALSRQSRSSLTRSLTASPLMWGWRRWSRHCLWWGWGRTETGGGRTCCRRRRRQRVRAMWSQSLATHQQAQGLVQPQPQLFSPHQPQPQNLQLKKRHQPPRTSSPGPSWNRCGAPRFNPLSHVVRGLKRKLEDAKNRIAELESEYKQRKT